MPSRSSVSPALNARIIHAALVLGVVLFWGIAYYLGETSTTPVAALPDRRVLYIALFLVSGILFGAAAYTAKRFTPVTGSSPDEWWQRNLWRAVVVWALVEAPTILGTLAYLLTRDFRALVATFAGLLLFANYRPSRLAEG
jgi:hypothetical protein